MKKISMLLVSFSMLLYSCNDLGGIPPYVGSNDCIFFTDANNNNLIESIDTDTIDLNIRNEFAVDTSAYKLRIYVDDRLIPTGTDYFLEIRQDDIKSYYLIFRSFYETKYYDNKFSTGHSIKYEFYCPHIFKDEEYHTILINCNMQNYFLRDKAYSLDGKAGNKLGNDIAEFIVE